jgi:hypothetical protein
LGKDANAGTRTAPVATLKQAIDLAAKGPGRVYACAETWTEPVVITSDVSLHGGFDCMKEWAYVGESQRSMLTPGPDEVPITWNDGAPDAKAFLTDFYVEAADAVKPGGSSIAIFLPGMNLAVTIKRCEAVAGNGADGADGVPADPNNLPAPAGTPGNIGGDACSAPLSKGGLAPQTVCDLGLSKGGAGGDAGPLTAEDGEAGEPTWDAISGLGGLGEANAPACTNGKNGADGQDGIPGLGGDGTAHVTAEGYVGVAGGDGTPGLPGQGGGGGGATFGKAAVCGAASPGGAAGGSGGSGGCGGNTATGGQPGGASIAIATRNVGTAILATKMVAGNSGNGGAGAPSQPGGKGGVPAQGGAGLGAIQPGCSGGAGGRGGKGGPSGGGQGGATVCLATVGNHGMGWSEGSECILGESSGEGGVGGDPMIPATYGKRYNPPVVATIFLE